MVIHRNKMVEVEGYLRNNIVSGTPSPLPRPYLPALPPQKTFKPSYSRFLVRAPFSALAGVVADARDPPKPPVPPRSRNRIQVGSTNRWRLPNSLGSDLLGSSQAVKAVTSSYNDTLLAIMTADNPITTCNYSESNVDRLLKEQPHLLTSTRLMRSQPAPTLSRTPRGSERRLIRSQPALPTESQCVRTSPMHKDLGTRPKHPTLNQLRQIDYQKNFLPPGMRSPTPMEMFLHKSQTVNALKAPDLILHALDTCWELHKPFVQKSVFLSSLVQQVEQTGMHNIDEEEEDYTQTVAATVVGGMSLEALKTAASGTSETEAAAGSDHALSRKQSSFSDRNRILTLKLRIRDPLITKHTFARALAALYEVENEMKVQESDVVGVLAVAHFLKFASLQKVCSEVMLRNIAAWSVCSFHAAASKYKQLDVTEACEKWLELNLVPQLSIQIYLSHLPQELLEKTLKSTRLFTWNEYSLYKLLSYWIFLQQHSTVQLMPSWGTVVTWFMSLPKTSSFLEREEGHGYLSLFRVLRIEGITESSRLDELQKMNVVPQSWLLRAYSQHYHALQGGGDMSLMTRFEQGAIRHGFIIEQQLYHHSEIISLHGFHFEVKVAKEDSVYSFHIERLRPNDPVLPFKACERHTFSMRQDREVRYCIRIQWVDGDIYKFYNTGVLCQGFGFSGKSKRSEAVVVQNVQMPLFVTVSLMFPPS